MKIRFNQCLNVVCYTIVVHLFIKLMCEQRFLTNRFVAIEVECDFEHEILKRIKSVTLNGFRV